MRYTQSTWPCLAVNLIFYAAVNLVVYYICTSQYDTLNTHTQIKLRISTIPPHKALNHQPYPPSSLVSLSASGLISSVRRTLASKLKGLGFKCRPGTLVGPCNFATCKFCVLKSTHSVDHDNVILLEDCLSNCEVVMV